MNSDLRKFGILVSSQLYSWWKQEVHIAFCCYLFLTTSEVTWYIHVFSVVSVRVSVCLSDR